MKVSIWLMTPPSVQGKLREQISYLSQTYTGPSFEPHVTLIGGLRCESAEQLQTLCLDLKMGLSGTGGISCQFREKVELMPAWNQACATVMEQSDNEEYMNLIEQTRKLLGLKDEHKFPSPLAKPHYTYFYGKGDQIPVSEVTLVPNFVSEQVAAWITNSDIEREQEVRLWKEILRIDL